MAYKKAFKLQAFRRDCEIGFRVEVHDNYHSDRNCTFDRCDDGDEDGDTKYNIGNMRARDPQRPADRQACLDHLLWKRQRGPFVSFVTSWRAAVRRRQMMIENGAKHVIIVAVWLGELPLVYDAFSIAQFLRLRRLNRFRHEVLVYGGISADSYRIWAIFHDNEKMVEATLSVYGIDVTVQMPGGFIDEISTKMHVGTQRLPDATDALRDEIYMCTGTRDDDKLFGLALSMGGIARRW